MRTVRFSGSIYLSLFSFFILSVLCRYENKIDRRALRVNAQAVDALRRCKIARGYEHREHRAEREQSALRAATSSEPLSALRFLTDASNCASLSLTILFVPCEVSVERKPAASVMPADMEVRAI